MSTFGWFILSLLLVIFAIATPVKVDKDETGIGRITPIIILIVGMIIGMLALKNLWLLSAGYGLICCIVFRIFDVPRQFPKKEVE